MHFLISHKDFDVVCKDIVIRIALCQMVQIPYKRNTLCNKLKS